jgi:hypothetical protein
LCTLVDRVAVTTLGVVTDLERLAPFGEARHVARVSVPEGVGGGGLAVCFDGERVQAGRLPLDLACLYLGGASARAVYLQGRESESCGLERGGGAGDDVVLGEPVSTVRDVPRADASSPAPAVGLEDLGGAVTLDGPFDDGSGLVRVRDREHVWFSLPLVFCREGDLSPARERQLECK